MAEKNPTKPQRVCLCNDSVAALLHPFPILLLSPRGRRYTDLFLSCSWFLFGTSRRGAASHEQRRYILWLCRPCPAWSPQSLSIPSAHHVRNVGATSSVSFLSSSQSGCLHLSLHGGKKKRKRKEKERIKVLIVKHLAVPGGNESRVISEITDGDVTEVHFPAAH